MAKNSITSVKGMRDFYPEDIACRDWLFSIWEESARIHGFNKYDGPLLETEELYTQKSGEEIVKQLYNFKDKGERKIALRPEMTPTLARMINAKGNSLPRPIKWFSIPQCFRYENIQKGRNREHYQWNLDIIGVESVSAEAEIISTAVYALKKMGLTSKDIKFKISSRELLERLLLDKNIPQNKITGVFSIIDKKNKISKEKLIQMLKEISLTDENIKNIFTVTEYKEIPENSSTETQNVYKDIENLFKYLNSYQIEEFCELDLSIVRGLAYYTGIVFEVFDISGKSRAICGGGRYDSLLQSLGGEKVPAVGLGMGDVVISQILEEKSLLKPLLHNTDYAVIAFSDKEYSTAIEISVKLRDKGKNTHLILEPKKLKKSLQQADRIKAKKAIIIAPEELKNNQVVLKDMSTGEEEKVSINDINSL